MQKIVWNSVLDAYFDEGTMSLHLKEWIAVQKKKGGPWAWNVVMEDTITSKEDVYKLIDAIFAEVSQRNDAFLEIDKQLFKIVQLWPYRIVIVYPPLSDGIEMTIAKPVKVLTLEDYKLDEKVMDLLKNHAKGVLIAGAPGSGKTTFAQAVIEMHMNMGKIVKTIESPRDLLVSDQIVQYSFSYGSHEDIRDILLLSRPDFSVFDEVRNVDDFELFKDLRLTGIGLLGVIHATRPVDSIQRFLGHIELGIIPQMIDTVIYIDKGGVGAIYQLSLVVKMPAWMDSSDLARPVILVSDFFEQKVLYEIYSFGEQIVVMPIDAVMNSSASVSSVQRHAKASLQREFEQLFNFDFLLSVKKDDKVILYVPERYRPAVIGVRWEKIRNVEEKLHISISVKSFADLPLVWHPAQMKSNDKWSRLVLQLPDNLVKRTVCILSDDELLYYTVDARWTIVVAGKGLVKKLEKKGFVFVDLDQL